MTQLIVQDQQWLSSAAFGDVQLDAAGLHDLFGPWRRGCGHDVAPAFRRCGSAQAALASLLTAPYNGRRTARMAQGLEESSVCCRASYHGPSEHVKNREQKELRSIQRQHCGHP